MLPKRSTRCRPAYLVTKTDIVDVKTFPNALLCLLFTVLTALAARRRAFYRATDDAMWCEMRLVFWESVAMPASSWLAGLESAIWEVNSDWCRLQRQYTCMAARKQTRWVWRFTTGALDYLAKLLFLSVVRWVYLGVWIEIWDFSKALLLWSAYTGAISRKYLTNLRCKRESFSFLLQGRWFCTVSILSCMDRWVFSH